MNRLIYKTLKQLIFMTILKNKHILVFLILFFQFLVPATSSLQRFQIPLASSNGEDRESWLWLPSEVISTESTEVCIMGSSFVDQSGNIHVVWRDATNIHLAGDDIDIFYKKWDVAVHAWTDTEVVSTESDLTIFTGYPSVVVDSFENVHITWDEVNSYADSGSDQDIFYKCYNQSLSFWKSVEVISVESNSSSSQNSLAIDKGNNLHVVWKDTMNIAGEGTDGDVYYKTKDFNTGLWSDVEVVSLQSTLEVYEPNIIIDDLNNVHVVWLDKTDIDGDGMKDVFYSYKNSSNWSIDSIISTESTNDCYDPSIISDRSNNIHVVWSDSTDYNLAGSDLDIFYKYYDSSSNLWIDTKVVSTESSDGSLMPSFVSDDDGNIHFIWYDLTNYHNSGGDSDIFYKYYDFSSDLWSLTEVVSTTSTSSVERPSLLIYSNTLHAIWSDQTPYNGSFALQDLIYRKFTGPPTVPNLSPIFPNPSSSYEISFDWDDSLRASDYYIYRSTEFLTSINDLTPIAVSEYSNYTDNLSDRGIYYYAVVAGNFELNSTMSNVVYVSVDRNYLDFGLFDLLILIFGFGVLQIITYIIISKRTQNLINKGSLKTEKILKDKPKAKSEKLEKEKK